MRLHRQRALLLWAACAAAWLPVRAFALVTALPPSPYLILDQSLLQPRFLDAAPLCMASGLDPQLTESVGLVHNHAVAKAHKQLAALLNAPEGLVEPALRLGAAVVNARAAGSAKQRSEALHVLNAELARGGPAPLRACANLERARLQLLLGQGPEASASARLVLRAAGKLEKGAKLLEVARFYRAEAYWRAQRYAEALPLYQQLVGSATPRLAAAAALRWADAHAEEQPPVETWKAMAELLNQGQHAGLDVSSFAPRASLLAIRAGDEKAAMLWITQAADLESDPRAAKIASLREADLLLARGQRGDARTLYERVASEPAPSEVHALAQERLAAYELVPEDESKRMVRLRLAEATPNPRITLVARDEIARRLLAEGALDKALEMLIRVGHDHPMPELVPLFSQTFNQALAEAVQGKGEAACLAAVRRLGGRRTVLLQNASNPEPLVRLGDCLISLGLPGAAQEMFRGVARNFGPAEASKLTLRLAEVNLALGDTAAVHATLDSLRKEEAHKPVVPQHPIAWLRIRGELARREGRNSDAARAWLQLLEGDHADAETALHLADVARKGKAPARAVASLRKALLDRGSALSPSWAEVSLLVADLLRIQRPSQALRMYQRAADNLPDGPLRSRAAFFAARLVASSDAWRDALVRSRAADSKNAWGRLADVELEAANLRLAMGREERAPR